MPNLFRNKRTAELVDCGPGRWMKATNSGGADPESIDRASKKIGVIHDIEYPKAVI